MEPLTSRQTNVDDDAQSPRLTPRSEVAPWQNPVGWQVPLVDLVLAVARHIRIFVLILILAMFAVLHQLKGIVPEYTASSISLVLSRDKAQFDASIETGSLETSEATPRAGSALPFTLPPNVDLYIMLMKSRSTMTRIADRFETELFESEGMPRDHRSPERARFVSSLVTITGSDDGMITVSVTARSAILAAGIANALVDASGVDSREIERGLLREQATVLQRAADAAFIELELVRARYAEFSDEHALLEPSLQAAGVIDGLQHFRSASSALEAQIRAELTRFREGSPSVQSLRAKLAESEERFAEMQTSIMNGAGVRDYGRIVMNFRQLGQLLDFRQDLYLVLSSQAEIYRIRAEFASGAMTVVRPASVPSTPSGPSRRRIAIVPIVLGMFLAFGWCVMSEQTRAIKGSSELMVKVHEIRDNLWRLVPFHASIRRRLRRA